MVAGFGGQPTAVEEEEHHDEAVVVVVLLEQVHELAAPLHV